MSDLTSLMQIAPGSASYMMGQNQGQQQESEKLKMMELAQIMQMKQAMEQRQGEMHPLEMQKAQQGLQRGAAELPGIMAQSDSRGTEARMARATENSTVDSTNTDNRNKVIRSALSQVGGLAGEIDAVPAVGRHQALSEAISNLGINGEFNKTLMDRFSKIPAAKLPSELKRINDALLRNTPDYAKTMDQEGLQQSGALQRAKVLATSREDVADTNAAARAARGGKAPPPDPSKDLMSWVLAEAKGKPPATQLAVFNRAITMAIQQGNTELAQSLYAQALPIKQQVDQATNAPRAGAVDMAAQTKGQVAVNPGSNMPLVSPGGPPQPNPLAGGGGQQDLGKLVQQQGEVYRPDMFEYRVGPNGKVQKRPKGG